MMASQDSFQEILKRHQQSPPVKVGDIARDLGLKVMVADLPLGISGKLSKDESGVWTIRVNRGEPKSRQRFTIAHEIAHFVLHRTQIEDDLNSELADDTFYRSGLSKRIEWEANRLAAEIVMPWHLIDQATGVNRMTPAALADQLQVSEVALRIRLGLAD
ncbi:ImmA/IrrE family metallo-endopeptidase [Caulobacter sp. Root487D2Y]|uniref:ImmA/IrrE family metallo-endopeptidase n=1 Tax=Caulobacter sp. Root487D2Y TaxID=1736547 RepID=UPI0009E76298|nr:ImmA/IrrE family metallo-endopeptidase [Caulobacter sp. Root487D2Y]